MSQDVVLNAVPGAGAGGLAATGPVIPGVVESPPAAPQPERGGGDEPRVRLHQLAERLARSRPRELLVEYLRLRRSLM